MTRPFRFGVVAATARTGVEWLGGARRMEDLGFALMAVPDGLQHTLAPFPALAAAAAATRTLRIGTYVAANDYRHPVLLAKEAASLDVLSDGRFELGIGAGRPAAAADHAMMGQPFDSGKVRLERLAEALRILKPLLAERVGWIRESAAERFDQIELNVNLMAVGGQVPGYLRRTLGPAAAQLAESDAVPVLKGSLDAMCDRLLGLRDRLGISCILVSEELLDAAAPVVARLAGR